MTPEEIKARLAANSDEIGISKRSRRIAKLIDKAVSREIRSDIAKGDDGKEAAGDIFLGVSSYMAAAAVQFGISRGHFACLLEICEQQRALLAEETAKAAHDQTGKA